MTLLEALLATVILSVVAVACLEGTRGAASLQHKSAATAHAVMQAEAALSQATAGGVVDARDARVTRVPYASGHGATGLDRIDVDVATPNGGTVRLTRLVPRAAERPR